MLRWPDTIQQHVWARLGLVSRLVRVFVSILVYAPALARLAIRDAAALRSAVRSWDGRSLAYSIPLTSVYILRVYALIFRAMPRLAGQAHWQYFNQICTLHEHYRTQPPVHNSERWLTDQIARQRKKEHIIFEFRRTLGLNVEDGQAQALSVYLRTGDLLREFLDYSLATKVITEANIRIILATALPGFARRHGAKTLFSQPASAATADVDHSLTGFYDRGYDLVDREVFLELAEEHRTIMQDHIVADLAELKYLTFRTVLLCEAHLCSCLYLGRELRQRRRLHPSFASSALGRLMTNLQTTIGGTQSPVRRIS